MAQAKIIKTSQTINQNLQKHLIKHLVGKNWTMLNMEKLTQTLFEVKNYQFWEHILTRWESYCCYQISTSQYCWGRVLTSESEFGYVSWSHMPCPEHKRVARSCLSRGHRRTNQRFFGDTFAWVVSLPISMRDRHRWWRHRTRWSPCRRMWCRSSEKLEPWSARWLPI